VFHANLARHWKTPLLQDLPDTNGRAILCYIPYEILQVAGENRTVPWHKGMDKRGQQMAHWALDQIIELIQHKFKSVDFPNTVEGWQHHHVDMPLFSRCVTHCNLKYSRRFHVDPFDTQFKRDIPDGNAMDKGNKRQSTVPLKRIREKTMIAKILCLTNTLAKTPERKLTDGFSGASCPRLQLTYRSTMKKTWR
jgi:hypothetical protein